MERSDNILSLNRNNYCVILAGGKGRRLWPCSRDNYPKQFIDFFGRGRTQIQVAYDRFVNIVPKDNIIICTNKEYTDIVKEQLPEVDDKNILFESINRNTAPCVSWACLEIMTRNSDANIVIIPSDLIIMEKDMFDKDITTALNFVSTHDTLLSIGVKPTRPEPGYGYIQVGDASDMENVFSVKSFTEKPEREFAEIFMNSGEFFWNTGIFLSNAKTLDNAFHNLFTDVFSGYQNEHPNYTQTDKLSFIKENYSSYPNLSIDYGILEHTDNVCVMTCSFGWADIGTWHSMFESARKIEGDNVVIDSNVIMDRCHDNVIKLPKDRLAVINGLDGYIVAEKDNVLLICKKGDSSALIRKYTNEIQIKYGDDFI